MLPTMHLPWARRCRDLPRDLRDEIHVLAGGFDGSILAIFEVGLGGDSPAFEDELAAFDGLAEDVVAYELSLAFGGYGCGPRDEHGPHLVHERWYRDEVLATSGGAEHATLVTAVFDDPAAVRDRYSRLLSRYWEGAFRDEWDRVLPRVEAEVTAGARALVTGGLPGLVAELLPEGHWDEETSSITIAKDWDDETRLQIARLVAEHARSTKELAQLLSLSDSAISRHLKILDGVGLVTSRRDGYFVLYQLHPERIDVLGGALRNTLGLAQSTAGEVPALPVSIGRGGRP